PLAAVLFVFLCLLPLTAAAITGTGRIGARRVAVFLARVAAWAAPLSLWWIVPYLYAIRTAAVTGTIQANTDVFAWSWTHVHNSFDRVLMLVAKWSWPDGRFGWSASAMGARTILWVAFVLPIGAVAAPLVCRPKHRRGALWLVTAMLGVAFVAKGLNGPLRGVNAFAYTHIPGMFLLREPMSKVGGLVVVAELAAWVLAIDGLVARTRALQRRGSSMVAFAGAAAVLLCAAPLAFAWPMLSGTVVQDRERVAVPAAWHQVARIVADAPRAGKVMVLPLDDFYQVPTTWGYYGSDVVPTQLFTRPTIARHPQAYIGDPPGFEELRDAVETSLTTGDRATTVGALRALGVSYIVVRKDIDFHSDIRSVDMVHPRVLTRGLARLGGVRQIATTSVADVYEVQDDHPPVQVLSGTIAAPNAEGSALASVVGSAPDDAAVVTSDANPGALQQGAAWRIDVNSGRTIVPPEAGDYEYERRSTTARVVALAREPRGLVLHEPTSIIVAGREIANRPDFVVPDSTGVLGVDVDGTLFDLQLSSAYARVAAGSQITTYDADGLAHLGQWGRLADCNRVADVPIGNALRLDLVAMPGGAQAIRLRADRHSACVAARVSDVLPGDVLHVGLEQRAVSGNPPRTCLWQPGVRACAPLSWTAVRDGDWYHLSAIYRVPAHAGPLSMFLYADGATARSEAWYRDVAVERLIGNRLSQVPPSGRPHGRIHLDAGPVSVATRFRAPLPIFGTRTGVSDCARHDDRSLAQLGIAAASPLARDPQAVHLSARGHSACVSMPVFGLQAAFNYELAFYANVAQGARPRICLWEDAQQRCARFDLVSQPDGPSGEFVYRGHIDPRRAAIRLFLYADAQGNGTTIDYRDLRMRALTDDAVVLRPAGTDAAAAPTMTWQRISSAEYRVQVRGAHGPFVLALSDAFSGAWHVGGLAHGSSIQHVELDGYRNGWTIDARGDLDLTVAYAPA
ncbi:MAG TPA: hypothetical protein VFR41_05750, partial [Acidimicrobiia bacterium]|nr:hypothetical protein [Acidimicrobiia bacterium]